MTRWRDHKTDRIEAHDIARHFVVRGAEKRCSPTVLYQRVADKHGFATIANDNRFIQISRDHIPFKPDLRLPGHVHTMIVVMNHIADQHGLRIGELHARRFTATDETVLDTDILHLLAEQHPPHAQMPKRNPFPIEDADGVSSMFIDCQAGNFNVRCTVRPLADVQYPDTIPVTQQGHLVNPGADQLNSLLAVNGEVLRIGPGFEKDGLPFLGAIDSLLNRREISRSVECDGNCSWCGRRILRQGYCTPNAHPRENHCRDKDRPHGEFHTSGELTLSIALYGATYRMISSAAMMLIGLTGGVATGKSTVARMFGQCGAIIIDADDLAREVVRPGKPAWREIVKEFGPAILNADRSLNRRAVGAIVFRNKAKRRRLERIIHPRVAREQMRLMRAAAMNNPHAVVIYDVPLLFEAGIDKRVDKTIVVTADRETQIARLRKRNGLTRTEAIRRINSQLPLAKKVARADYVLDGTMKKPLLSKVTATLFHQLQRLT